MDDERGQRWSRLILIDLGMVKRFKVAVKEKTGHEFLVGRGTACIYLRVKFDSWMNELFYTEDERFPEEWGTAVNVQAMVYGNMGETSATGVAFTLTPPRAKIYLTVSTWSTQGEDVAARTPSVSDRGGAPLGQVAGKFEEERVEKYPSRRGDARVRRAHRDTTEPGELLQRYGDLEFTIQTVSCGYRKPVAASARVPPRG